MQFSDVQPSVLILDSGTYIGLFLSKELLEQGLKVHLILDEKSTNPPLYESIVSDQNQFDVHYYTNDCLSNYVDIFFRFRPQKIFITPPKLVLNKLFSPHLDATPMQELPFRTVELMGYAQNQSIEVIRIPGYYCTSIEIEGIVDTILAYLKSPTRHFIVNSLDVPLWIFPSDSDAVDSNLANIDFQQRLESHSLRLRDVIKMVFEIVGAELEFCGRGVHERGVIVDYEEELLLESPHIRLGNTVVKINDILYTECSEDFTSAVKISTLDKVNLLIVKWLKKLIKEKLCK